MDRLPRFPWWAQHGDHPAGYELLLEPPIENLERLMSPVVLPSYDNSYLSWYNPNLGQNPTLNQRVMYESPFCTMGRRKVNEIDQRGGREARRLYFEGLFYCIQLKIHAGSFVPGTTAYTERSNQNTPQVLTRETATQMLGSNELKFTSLDHFSKVSPSGFKSALHAFGVRKLGELHASTNVCAMAFRSDVHNLLEKFATDQSSDEKSYRRKMYATLHGNDQILIRNSSTVEQEDVQWKLIWTKDVLDVLDTIGGDAKVSLNKDDWIDHMALEAYVVTIPHAAARKERGLLQAVSNWRMSGNERLSAYDNMAAQAVIAYKWAAFGKKWMQAQMCLYCSWLISFFVYYCVHQDWMKPKNDEVKNIIMWISNIIATLCMLPFLSIELLQLWNSSFDWTRSLWNILDVTLFGLQLTCFIMEFTTIEDQNPPENKSLQVAMGFQVFFLFIKLQYFSRTLDISYGSLMESILSVIFEIRWFLGNYVITLFSFGLVFGSVFPTQGKEEEKSDAGMDQDSETFTDETMLLISKGGNKHSSDSELDFTDPFKSFSSLFSVVSGGLGLDDMYFDDRNSAWLFMVFQGLMSLIALNMLIAIMTEAYDRVSRKKYKMLLASRAELITELESLRLPRDRFYGPKPPQFLHFLVQKGCSTYAAEHEEDPDVEDSGKNNEEKSTLDQPPKKNEENVEMPQERGECIGNTFTCKSGHWKEGDYLSSKDKRYEAVFSNGTLEFWAGYPKMLYWSVGKAGSGSSPRVLTLKSDGDLVMEDQEDVHWFTGSVGAPNSMYEVSLENNGLFVLKQPSGSQKMIVWFGPDLDSNSFRGNGYTGSSESDLVKYLEESHKKRGLGGDGDRPMPGQLQAPRNVTHIIRSTDDDLNVGNMHMQSGKMNYVTVWQPGQGVLAVYDQGSIKNISMMHDVEMYGRRIWSTQIFTDASGRPLQDLECMFCANGMLKVVDRNGVTKWKSHEGSTDESLRPFTLELMDDRNLVIFDNMHNIMWYSSGRDKAQGEGYGNAIRAPFQLNQFDYLLSLNGEFKAVMQEDGDFIVYRIKDRMQWWDMDTSHTVDHGPYQLQFDSNGALRIHSRDKVLKALPAVPDTTEKLRGPFTLTLSDSGMLNLYEERVGFRRKLWTRGLRYDKYKLLGDSLSAYGAAVQMEQGYKLVSSNRTYRLKMEPTGCAVLYRLDRNCVETEQQHIGEEQDPLKQPFYLEFRKNGQLRLISNGVPYFETPVADGSPPYTLKLGRRGELNIHDSKNESMWRMPTP